MKVFPYLAQRLQKQIPLSLITLAGLITISLSAYLILYSGPIFRKISPLLNIFEEKNPTKGEHEDDDAVIDYIVIGTGRFGNNLAKGLLEKGYEIILVDFDPETVK